MAYWIPPRAGSILSYAMTALDRVGLTQLMARTEGCASIRIGLIDGPVHADHPDLAASTIRPVSTSHRATCHHPGTASCAHGTFIAAMLVARRDAQLPGICPDCTLLVRPIFGNAADDPRPPRATPDELAAAILDCVNAGARVINLSLALDPNSLLQQPALERALEDAVRRGVILVVAAGNQNAIGGTPITNHPWPIPVMACDPGGRPSAYSNFGPALCRGGLSAPGDAGITPSAASNTSGFRGTSIAAPYVTGTVALLWSLFPAASAQQIKLAVTPARPGRPGLAAPVLNANRAYDQLA